MHNPSKSGVAFIDLPHLSLHVPHCTLGGFQGSSVDKVPGKHSLESTRIDYIRVPLVLKFKNLEIRTLSHANYAASPGLMARATYPAKWASRWTGMGMALGVMISNFGTQNHHFAKGHYH